MKTLLTFLAVVAVAVVTGSASASHVVPVYTWTVCLNGQTTTYHGTAAGLAVFLYAHGATVGECVEEPPVVPPVVIPPVEALPDTPTAVFLCYSRFLGSTPGSVPYDLIQIRVDQGWFAAIAVTTAEATKQGIPADKWTQPDAAHVLVCNPDGLRATGTGLNGSGGDFLDAEAWKTLLQQQQYDPLHRNAYEIYA